MKKMHVLVVDDVPLARRKLVRALRAHADVEIVGEAASGPQMIEAIALTRPDLMFLDVSMPEQDGFSALSEVAPELRPLVVFVTAHAQFALSAFRFEAIDYLLKPADAGMIAGALSRVRKRLASPASSAANPTDSPSIELPERLALRTDTGLRVLSVGDIDWIEAVGNYLAIHANRETIVVRSTLQALMAQLDPRAFARVHRSALVSVRNVRELRQLGNGAHRMLLADGTELPIGPTYRQGLLKLLSR